MEKSVFIKALRPLFFLSFSCLFLPTLLAQDRFLDSIRTEIGKIKADTQKIKQYNKLVYLCQNLKPAIADSFFALSMDLVRKTGFKKGMVEALNYKAYGLSTKGVYKEASEIHREAMAAAKSLNNLRLIAETYNYLGNIELNLGNYERALATYDSSIRVSSSAGLESTKYHSLASQVIVYNYQGNYTKAFEIGFKVLAYFEKNQSPDLGNHYSTLAAIYGNTGKTDIALSYAIKAYNKGKEGKDETHIANYMSNIGTLLMVKNDLKNAETWMLNAYEIDKKTNNIPGQSRDLVSIGNIYFHQENFARALTYYKKAYDLALQTGNRSSVITAAQNVGLCHLSLKNYGEADKYFKESLRIGTEMKSADDLMYSYFYLSGLKREEKKFNEALDYFEKYILYRDSTTNLANVKKLAEAEANYRLDKKDQQNKLAKEKQEALYQADLKQKQILIYSAIGGLILAVVIIFLGIKNSIQKQKNLKELSEKNIKIENASKIIEEKNKEITDSINYAERIQFAILPEASEISSHLSDHFIFYLPKDIVSGDFYFPAQWDPKLGIHVT